MTARIRLSILSTSLVQKSIGNFFHSSSNTFMKSLLVFSFCFDTALINIFHMFLMGFKSGDCAGHFVSVIFFELKNFLEDSET